MPEEPSASSGQEPTPSTPQAGTSQPSGQAPDGATKPTMSLDDALAALKAAREEAAGHRVSNKELQAKLKTFEDAQLSESEKKDKALAEAQRAHAQAQEAYQRLLVKQAVLDMAPDLGIKGKLAAALINWSSLKIDDEGNVDGLEQALKALLKEYPDIAVDQPQPSTTPQQRPQPQVPATNPPRGGTGAAPVNPRYMSWGEAFNKRQ